MEKKPLNVKVQADDSGITAMESVSYIGCVLDCHLSAVGKTQRVITKVNHRIRFLAGISTFLDHKTMLILAGA